MSGDGEWGGWYAENDIWDAEFEFFEKGVEERGVEGFLGGVEDDCEI